MNPPTDRHPSHYGSPDKIRISVRAGSSARDLDVIVLDTRHRERWFTVSTGRSAIYVGVGDFSALTAWPPSAFLLLAAAALVTFYVTGVPPADGLIMSSIPLLMAGGQWALGRRHVRVQTQKEADTVMHAARRLHRSIRTRDPQSAAFAEALAAADASKLVEISHEVLEGAASDTRPSPTPVVDQIAGQLREAASMLSEYGRPEDATTARELAHAIAHSAADQASLPVVDQEDARHAAVTIQQAYGALLTAPDEAARADGRAAVDAAAGLLRRCQDYLHEQNRDALRALRAYSRQWVESDLTLPSMAESTTAAIDSSCTPTKEGVTWSEANDHGE